jgi:hypothetical protein
MNSIFETLKELSNNQPKKESKSKRKDPSYIYLDEIIKLKKYHYQS